MKCQHCGRALTFHRAEEHPPIAVLRPVEEVADTYYCGVCFDMERHEHRDDDFYAIGLGDSRDTQRWVPLVMERAA